MRKQLQTHYSPNAAHEFSAECWEQYFQDYTTTVKLWEGCDFVILLANRCRAAHSQAILARPFRSVFRPDYWMVIQGQADGDLWFEKEILPFSRHKRWALVRQNFLWYAIDMEYEVEQGVSYLLGRGEYKSSSDTVYSTVVVWYRQIGDEVWSHLFGFRRGVSLPASHTSSWWWWQIRNTNGWFFEYPERGLTTTIFS